jgi:hypothetical protein
MTPNQWKLLSESVPGVSHEKAGLPCQDQSVCEWMHSGGEPVLLLACADGAGSAAHADTGARIATQAITEAVRAALDGGLRVSEIDGDRVMAWHHYAREQLGIEAARRDAKLRDFACTLLMAVVGKNAAVFSQIGDGAIVLEQSDAYRTVFWPQAGEYLNTTNFLTDDEFERRLEHCTHREPVDELALLTDGLQMLALSYAEKRVHAPFFRPMFQTLRATEDPSALQQPFLAFLTSQRVNERTDDDKTLILATRRLPDDPALSVRQPESTG